MNNYNDSNELLRPFPVLASLAGEQWKMWRQSLIRELGDENADLQSYLPMWLRRNSAGIPAWWSELADYEWSLYWVVKPENQITAESRFMMNPFARVLRLRFDIAAWIAKREGAPVKRDNILVIGPGGSVEASFEMAAMIEELQDGVASKELLFETLEREFAGKLDWAGAFQVLEKIGFVVSGI